jgi:hypothetical protein|tara:strand:- start:1401 stop:2429 length:1029 start_codon:yes stop_codon:yes gene_type:complete
MSDIVQDFSEYRIRSIEIAEAKYYESLIRVLDNIEKQVTSLAGRTLPLNDRGQLFDLKIAVAMQPKIRAILEKEYLAWADNVVREGYNKQAKRVEKAFKTIGRIPVEFQQLTNADLTLITNLKRQSFTQFKDVSNTFTRKLSEKIYQSTLTSVEFVELEDDLRKTINGIYASSKDEDINRLVKNIKKDEVRLRKLRRNSIKAKQIRQKLDLNVQTLQSKFASDRNGENMKRYAGQILNDGLREFDAQLNLAKSIDAGLTYVKYQGSNIATTRDHCRLVRNGTYDKRKGGLFTIDEVINLWKSRGWQGKKSGSPFIVRGGYNCRHQWSFVNPDWYDNDGQLII